MLLAWKEGRWISFAGNRVRIPMKYQNLDILHTEEPFLILQLFRKYPDPNAPSLTFSRNRFRKRIYISLIG